MDGTAMVVGVYVVVGNVVVHNVVIVVAVIFLVVAVGVTLLYYRFHSRPLATVAKGCQSFKLPFQHGIITLVLLDNPYKPILINQTLNTIILFRHNFTLLPDNLQLFNQSLIILIQLFNLLLILFFKLFLTDLGRLTYQPFHFIPNCRTVLQLPKVTSTVIPLLLQLKFKMEILLTKLLSFLLELKVKLVYLLFGFEKLGMLLIALKL